MLMSNWLVIPLQYTEVDLLAYRIFDKALANPNYDSLSS